jgi:prephenate dehydrogenase
MDPLNLRRIVIVGTGLLGGSLGLSLKRAGFHGVIVGVGRSTATLDKARSACCIDEASTDLSAAASAPDTDLIVLAAPVATISQHLARLGSVVRPGTVITDVGSTKRHIVHTAESALAFPHRFVGSHPMAGSEAQGPEHASAHLFHHRPVIVTPTSRTDPSALALVENLWTLLGMRLVRMDAASHDRIVARVSHLPHLSAVLLTHLAQRESGTQIASTGFASATRVAAGDPHLWADIFLDNRDGLLASLDEWDQLAAQFRSALAAGDREALLQLLTEAQHLRKSFHL